MEHDNTSAFYFLAWASFSIASISTLIGIFYLPVDVWIKGYLGLGYLFTLTTCFTLAKTIRDKHEAIKFINRVKEAKTEKFLTEYEKMNSNLS